MRFLLAVFSGNLGKMASGMSFGWASPSLPLLLHSDSPLPLTPNQASWIVSLFCPGILIGALIPVFSVNLIGRKLVMFSTALPAITSWIIIAYATRPWELYIARFLAGVGAGTSFVVVPMYLGEISPAYSRGLLIALSVVSAKLGGILEYSIGPFLSKMNLALVSLIVPVLYSFTFACVPETPYYLMRHNRREEALKSLSQLRNKKDVAKELELIERTINADMEMSTDFKDILLVPSNRRALIVVLGLVLIQQGSGCFVILSYAQMIFDASKFEFQGKYLTIVFGIVQLLASGGCALIIDRCGRKPLLLISMFGSMICMSMTAVYFHMRALKMDTSHFEWLPAIGVILYIAMYALGLSCIPDTMMGELFATNVKALGSTLMITWSSIVGFVFIKSFQGVVDNFGMHVAFWFFAAVSLVGMVFTFSYVPETKGKTFEEIQKKLQGLEKNKPVENETYYMT